MLKLFDKELKNIKETFQLEMKFLEHYGSTYTALPKCEDLRARVILLKREVKLRKKYSRSEGLLSQIQSAYINIECTCAYLSKSKPQIVANNSSILKRFESIVKEFDTEMNYLTYESNKSFGLRSCGNLKKALEILRIKISRDIVKDIPTWLDREINYLFGKVSHTYDYLLEYEVNRTKPEPSKDFDAKKSHKK